MKFVSNKSHQSNCSNLSFEFLHFYFHIKNTTAMNSFNLTVHTVTPLIFKQWSVSGDEHCFAFTSNIQNTRNIQTCSQWTRIEVNCWSQRQPRPHYTRVCYAHTDQWKAIVPNLTYLLEGILNRLLFCSIAFLIDLGFKMQTRLWSVCDVLYGPM